MVAVVEIFGIVDLPNVKPDLAEALERRKAPGLRRFPRINARCSAHVLRAAKSSVFALPC
jgi:hypothetical protein